MRWLIEREEDELLSPKDEGLKDAMQKLPGAVESWMKEKMSQLAELLPASRHVGVDNAGFRDDLSGDSILIDSLPPFLEESDEPDLHLLFTCLSSTIPYVQVLVCAVWRCRHIGIGGYILVCTFVFSYCLQVWERRC